MESNNLTHSGIKGMQWGVRRWQAKDGSLTPAGVLRYRKQAEKLKQKNAKLDAKLKNKRAVDRAKARVEKLRAENEAKKKVLKGKTDDDAAEKAKSKKAENTKEESTSKPASTPARKPISEMSDVEVQAYANRLGYIEKIKVSEAKLNPQTESKAKTLIKKIGKDVIAPALIDVGKTQLKNFLNKKFSDVINADEIAAKKEKADRAKWVDGLSREEAAKHIGKFTADEVDRMDRRWGKEDSLLKKVGKAADSGGDSGKNGQGGSGKSGKGSDNGGSGNSGKGPSQEDTYVNKLSSLFKTNGATFGKGESYTKNAIEAWKNKNVKVDADKSGTGSGWTNLRDALGQAQNKNKNGSADDSSTAKRSSVLDRLFNKRQAKDANESVSSLQERLARALNNDDGSDSGTSSGRNETGLTVSKGTSTDGNSTSSRSSSGRNETGVTRSKGPSIDESIFDEAFSRNRSSGSDSSTSSGRNETGLTVSKGPRIDERIFNEASSRNRSSIQERLARALYRNRSDKSASSKTESSFNAEHYGATRRAQIKALSKTHTYDEIAQMLGIAPSTVAGYMKKKK